MEMPKPGPGHARLRELEGAWRGEEKQHPSPWDPTGGVAVGTIRARVELGGFFVVSEYVEEKDGQVVYRGHGVYGYDGASDRYTMHWFDSMGGAFSQPATGRWDGPDLVFEGASSAGRSRYVYRLHGDRYDFRIETSRDGDAWTTFLEATYVKQ